MAYKGKAKRKPLSEKQKAERRKNLAAAREKKSAPKYVSVAANVRALEDAHPLSLMNTRKHIKNKKEERLRLKKILRKSNDRKVIDEYNRVDCYVQNMEYYVRNGLWLDLFFGENQENKIGFRCLTPAYEADGTMKRSVGIWYDDIGGLYTKEMYETDTGTFEVRKPKRARKKKKKLLTSSS
jgi:hypothetical protein